ncbi:hypothetical protein RQP46_007371 [Phenoliferia psychrophenolica]
MITGKCSTTTGLCMGTCDSASKCDSTVPSCSSGTCSKSPLGGVCATSAQCTGTLSCENLQCTQKVLLGSSCSAGTFTSCTIGSCTGNLCTGTCATNADCDPSVPSCLSGTCSLSPIRGPCTVDTACAQTPKPLRCVAGACSAAGFRSSSASATSGTATPMSAPSSSASA